MVAAARALLAKPTPKYVPAPQSITDKPIDPILRHSSSLLTCLLPSATSTDTDLVPSCAVQRELGVPALRAPGDGPHGRAGHATRRPRQDPRHRALRGESTTAQAPYLLYITCSAQNSSATSSSGVTPEAELDRPLLPSLSLIAGCRCRASRRWRGSRSSTCDRTVTAPPTPPQWARTLTPTRTSKPTLSASMCESIGSRHVALYRILRCLFADTGSFVIELWGRH